MATALIGEELLASETTGAEGGFQYSGGGLGGAYYGGLIDEQLGVNAYRGNPYLSEETSSVTNETGNSSAFKSDKKPKGFNWGDYYNAKSLASDGEQAAKGILDTISGIYNTYRENRKLKIDSIEDRKDRYRAGIVFRGKENRDQLVRENRIPAYYSTTNIKSLLRRGIMPFGWSSTMAIEQGFGKEIFAQEQKLVIERKTDHLLRREKDKNRLRKSLGELENLKNKFKTRKILEYYNQN